MKLFRRTRWKPKQKLRKEDIQFLLAEYRATKSAFNITLSLCASLSGIGIASYFIGGDNPSTEIKAIIVICAWSAFIFLFLCGILGIKASRIGKVLEIKKRLKRYGVD